jgi:hypothetical protein
MKILTLFLLLFSHSSFAAILHFYDNPNVPQPLFHVTIEYKGYIYDADTRGSEKYPAYAPKKISKYQIFIEDDFVNEDMLEDQLGRKFDFNFEWHSEKTYCSKLVGLALGIRPIPMSFAGTHYIRFKPHWIERNDPGLSPDDIFEFGMKYGIRLN